MHKYVIHSIILSNVYSFAASQQQPEDVNNMTRLEMLNSSSCACATSTIYSYAKGNYFYKEVLKLLYHYRIFKLIFLPTISLSFPSYLMFLVLIL